MNICVYAIYALDTWHLSILQNKLRKNTAKAQISISLNYFLGWRKAN